MGKKCPAKIVFRTLCSDFQKISNLLYFHEILKIQYFVLLHGLRFDFYAERLRMTQDNAVHNLSIFSWTFNCHIILALKTDCKLLFLHGFSLICAEIFSVDASAIKRIKSIIVSSEKV